MPTKELVATLSATAVVALTNLVQVPPDVNAVVHQQMQTIVRQLPPVGDELLRLELVRPTDSGGVALTAAGQRLATWFLRHWRPWTHDSRHLPGATVAPWHWEVIYHSGHVDRL